MKKLALMFSTGLLAAAVAMSAAADTGKMKGESMMMGAHKMTGTVDKIDHAKGTLMLKNSMSDMMLHFPPASIKDLNNGDTITVELGYMKGGKGMMEK